MTRLGFIGMVHHAHEGVWPEEHEPYTIHATREDAEVAAAELIQREPRATRGSLNAVVVEVHG